MGIALTCTSLAPPSSEPSCILSRFRTWSGTTSGGELAWPVVITVASDHEKAQRERRVTAEASLSTVPGYHRPHFSASDKRGYRKSESGQGRRAPAAGNASLEPNRPAIHVTRRYVYTRLGAGKAHEWLRRGTSRACPWPRRTGRGRAAWSTSFWPFWWLSSRRCSCWTHSWGSTARMRWSSAFWSARWAPRSAEPAGCCTWRRRSG